MSSDDATLSSPSLNLDLDYSLDTDSEDETTDTLKREIDALIENHGRELFKAINSKVLSNGSNSNVEEQKDQKATYDIKEKLKADELEEKIESLIAKHGRELYSKFATKGCFYLYKLTSELNDLDLDDLDEYQKRKRGESTSLESTSLSGKYESPGESEDSSQGSADHQVIAYWCPLIVSNSDENESERMNKKIKSGEGSSNPDKSQEPSAESAIENLAAKRKLDYDSASHGIKDQDQEMDNKKNLEEEKVKKDESSDFVQQNLTSEEEKMEEDESKNQGKSVQ